MASTVLLLPCVDDILPAYKSLGDVLSVKAKLKERYRMTDLGPVRRFLGLDVVILSRKAPLISSMSDRKTMSRMPRPKGY